MGIRSFIALQIPDACRTRVTALQSDLRRFGEPVKWVRPEGIHLTLKFLGDIVEPQVLSIGDALGRIARGRESFRVHIVGLGAFPRLKQARVLWIGLQDDGNRLVSLAQSIEQSLEPLGFPKEKRNFSPHLTLGRVRARLSEDFVAHFRDLHFDAGAFTAERVCLMRSQLKPSGAVYSEMAAFSLKQD